LNRERINREGISTGQVAMALRTAVYGKEISRFRDANEDYPINLRVKDEQKSNVDILKNMSIIYRDMGKGGMVREKYRLSAFIDMEYQTTYGGIKRKDGKRIITLSSDVITGYNAE
jgi:multidrug efflux pump